MDPLAEVLRSARHEPAATETGLADVRRRGRRRRTAARAAVAGTAFALAGAVVVVASAEPWSASVVPATPTATPEATFPAGYVVVGTVRWRDARVSADGRVLTVSYSNASRHDSYGCLPQVWLRTVETADSVTVTLDKIERRSERPPPSNLACLTNIHQEYQDVPLSAPLGDRLVLDGSDGGERPTHRPTRR